MKERDLCNLNPEKKGASDLESRAANTTEETLQTIHDNIMLSLGNTHLIQCTSMNLKVTLYTNFFTAKKIHLKYIFTNMHYLTSLRKTWISSAVFSEILHCL
jgi:hypothetical protein